MPGRSSPFSRESNGHPLIFPALGPTTWATRMRCGSWLSLADGLMATCVPGFILECGADTWPGLERHRREALACNPRGSPSLQGPELRSPGWNDPQLVGGWGGAGLLWGPAVPASFQPPEKGLPGSLTSIEGAGC